MADTESYTTKPQRLGPQVPPTQTNPSKFYTQFLYKALIVSIFLVLLPLFPSQAPEFVNQTRSWELLQLLFVGIAVSYGIFSKRNDETEKEHTSKFDNAQSFVSRLLQVSSVFDDETENPSFSDENKVQTWNSQYYRGEPMVVVAEESSVVEEQSSTSTPIVEKPLLLPIRSLKTHVSSPDLIESTNDYTEKSGSLSWSSSKSRSKRFSSNSNKSRNGQLGGVSVLDLEEKVEEKIVHRSPIPWRSRSGRMEMKEDMDGPPQYSLPPSMEDSEFNRLESRSFRSQSSRSPKPSSNSPSPSISFESQSKNVEDIARKKIYHKSSPPPPPPLPPPPSFLHKSPLIKSNSTVTNDGVSVEKELKRSIRSVPKEFQSKENSVAEWRQRSQIDSSLMRNSAITRKQIEPVKAREFGEDGMNANAEKRGPTEKFPLEVKKDFMEQVVVESDEDSESEEEDDFEGNLENQEVASNSVSDVGPDVDKKADEFIAKFREQIRLQRIASIRKSTGQVH